MSPSPPGQHARVPESHQQLTCGCNTESGCHSVALPVNHVEDGQSRVYKVHATRQKHEVALLSRWAFVTTAHAVRIICTASCHATEAPTPARHMSEIVPGALNRA